MRYLYWIAFAFLVVASEPALSWEAIPVQTPGKVLSFREDGPSVLLETDKGWWRAAKSDISQGWSRVPAPGKIAVPSNALPDGTVIESKSLGGRVYLSGPTKKYRHGVLGDAIEAEALVLDRTDGRKEIVEAGRDAVFEDLVPRLADLDNDGIPEILVVKSYLDRGAALAVIGRNAAGVLAIIGETPAIGTANRWLNPVGVATFTGSKEKEIALVRMPHALGRLEIWRWSEKKLKRVLEASDTSNHAIGSRELGLSAIADFDGDGIADLAIPSFDRRSLRLLSFKQGVSEIVRIPLPGQVISDIILIGEGSRIALLLAVADGGLVQIRN